MSKKRIGASIICLILLFVSMLALSACGEVDGEKAYLRINANGNESDSGDYILFGEYPQTIKAYSVTITITQNDKGYYLGSDGNYYAKFKKLN